MQMIGCHFTDTFFCIISDNGQVKPEIFQMLD
jgi:hypothetical protein